MRGVISLKDINARSDLWAVGSGKVLTTTKKTTRPCSTDIQGTPKLSREAVQIVRPRHLSVVASLAHGSK